LADGRAYRFQTFTLPRHPTRLYLISLDCSKLLGYRDTYIFYLRNPDIKRLNGSDADREYLRTRGLLPTTLKNRPLTLCIARNVFRVFGHTVVKRGRAWYCKILYRHDDYFVGDTDEPSVDETIPIPVELTDTLTTDTGMVDFAKTLSQLEGGPIKRMGSAILGYENATEVEEGFVPQSFPVEIANDEWMMKCTLSAADFNRRLVNNRPSSFLDLHTNIEQVSSITQPSVLNVQYLKTQNLDFKCVQNDLMIKSKKRKNQSKDKRSIEEGGWCNVYTDKLASKYPLSLLPNQYQQSVSL
jgi:hypothetical protein